MSTAALILAVLLIAAASTEPICKYLEQDSSHLFCKPGKDSYTLAKGLVSENNQTISITLRACRISGIQQEAFYNLFFLKNIDLSHNNIKKLTLGVLDGGKGVTYLNISYNAVNDLPICLFDKKPNLEVLDVKGNKLTSIEPGVFDPLTKLKHLDLSSNQLNGERFDSYIFEKNKVIRFLDFSRNVMTNTPDNILDSFIKLDFLNLERCSLKEVPYFATRQNLGTLRHLIISNNQIRELDRSNTFQNLEWLQILDLTANSIATIHADIFQPLKKLSMIKLRNNRLSLLPENLFQNLVNLVTIDLANNLLKYIPVNAFHLVALKNLNVSGNRFTYLQSNFVLEVRNSAPRFSKFLFGRNPWQCHCLLEVVDEVKKYAIDYDTSKYTGQVPVCVSSSERYCKRSTIDNDLYSALFEKLTKSS